MFQQEYEETEGSVVVEERENKRILCIKMNMQYLKI